MCLLARPFGLLHGHLTRSLQSEKETTMRSFYRPHARVHPPEGGDSLTMQSMAAECDINNIVSKYQKTGLLDHVQKHGPQYGDMSSSHDFTEAMNLVTEAQSMFEELPSSIRKKFNNDPTEFLDFVAEPENRDEMVILGLLDAPTGSAEPDPAPAGDPPPNPEPEAPEPPPTG